MAIQFPTKNRDKPNKPRNKKYFYYFLYEIQMSIFNLPIDSISSVKKPLFGVAISRNRCANIPNDAKLMVDPHA